MTLPPKAHPVYVKTYNALVMDRFALIMRLLNSTFYFFLKYQCFFYTSNIPPIPGPCQGPANTKNELSSKPSPFRKNVLIY